MELGRIANIDQSQANNVEKVQKIQEVDNDQKIRPDEKYKDVKPNEIIEEPNEVILDNIKFGYNKSSKDFFVKVTRGDAEYKFPTEDMMKLKAHLLEAIKAEQKANN
mgnify:CR=1 FL=1